MSNEINSAWSLIRSIPKDIPEPVFEWVDGILDIRWTKSSGDSLILYMSTNGKTWIFLKVGGVRRNWTMEGIDDLTSMFLLKGLRELYV